MKRKVSKSKRFSILDDIYGASVLVLCGIPWSRSRALILKWMKWDENDLLVKEALETGGPAGLFHDYRNPKRFVLYFERAEPGAGELAHECFHLVHKCFQQSAIGLTDQSQEAWAYYLDWWVRKIGWRVWPR